MAKKKDNSKGNKPARALLGLEVKSFDRFLIRCSAAVSSVLKGKLHWTAADSTIKDVRFLSSMRATFAESKQRQVPVLPYVADRFGIPTHWVAVAFTGESISNRTYISHVSIQIYKGEATDNRKELLFRAEWDAAQDVAVRHGQPHWHFHRKRDEEPLYLDFPVQSLEADVTDIGEQPEWLYRHFHFPMASRFHEGVADCVVQSSEDHLLRWVFQTLAYVLDELEIVLSISATV